MAKKTWRTFLEKSLDRFLQVVSSSFLGSMMKHLTDQPIDIATVLESARSPEAGATVVFLGTVRRTSHQKTVAYLQYECYPEMAESLLEQLSEEARSQWSLQGCWVVHRVGRLQVGEISVAIVCSAEHREPAFQAAHWLIDQIKHRVPIWKKEWFTDGQSHWVSTQTDSFPLSADSGDSG